MKQHGCRLLKRSWTIAITCLLMLFTGCFGESATPRTSHRAEAPVPAPTTIPRLRPAPAPEIGDCRRLSWHQAAATTASEASVPCRDPHTAETYAVGQLPVLQRGHRLRVDSASLTARVAQICPRRLSRSFGVSDDDLRLLSVKPVWFVPSPREAEAGATWFRCDAIVIAGHQRLARLSGPLKSTLADPKRRQGLALCGTTAPGMSGFARVPCSRPHRWRAIASVDLAGDDYPKGPAVLAASCREAAHEVADDPLDFEWSQELPTRAQWRAGQRYGVCWTPA